jgi:hypothetical protein
MNLTALIAELFVGGVLCLLWLALLLSACFDSRVLVAFLKDNPVGGPAVFSVIAYALGVIFDRV